MKNNKIFSINDYIANQMDLLSTNRSWFFKSAVSFLVWWRVYMSFYKQHAIAFLLFLGLCRFGNVIFSMLSWISNFFIKIFIWFLKDSLFFYDHIPSLIEILLPEIIFSFTIIFFLLYVIKNYSDLQIKNSLKLWFIIKNLCYVYFFVFYIIAIEMYISYLHKSCLLYKGLIFDFYSYFIKLVIILMLAFAIGCSYVYYSKLHNISTYETPILFLFLTLFLLFLVSSFDFFILFFCTEGITFCLVLLMIYNYNFQDSTYIAMKYLILGSLAAGLFGFGIAILYSMSNETDFYLIQKFLQLNISKMAPTLLALKFNSDIYSFSTITLSFAIIFICFGFFFKLSIAPMHQWIIDVYNLVNWGLLFIFSIVIKIAFFSVFIRCFFYVFSVCWVLWIPLMAFGALLSLFIGSFGGLNAFNFREFIAYSSLSQLGFLILTFTTNNISGLTSGILFFFYYICSMFLIFLILTYFSDFDLKLENNNNEENNNKLTVDSVTAIYFDKDFKRINIKNNLIYENMYKLSRKKELILGFNSLRIYSRKPLIAFCFSVAVIVLSGLPPLPGFFAKFFILLALVKAGSYIYAAIALFFSFLSIFYYIKILMLLWIDFSKNSELPAEGLDNKNNLFSLILNFKDYIKISNVYYKNNLNTILIGLLLIILIFSIFFISFFWKIFLLIIAKGIFYFL